MTDELWTYLLRHTSPEGEYLHRVDRRSHLRLVGGQMVSGHLQGRLLKLLTALLRPNRVLEIGTFTGYSALCLAEGLLTPGATLDTIEANDELEDFIRENLSGSPHGERVRLHIGRAEDVIPRLCSEPTFDLVFIDADKRHYCDYYALVLPRLKPGGCILADNTLWYGHVVDPAYARDAQTRGILAFNDLVAADPAVEQVILPLRDGLTLIRKK